MSFVKKTIDVCVAEGERVGLLCGLDGHLDEIARQRDPELEAVVEQLCRGDVYGAVERLNQQVVGVPKREARAVRVKNRHRRPGKSLGLRVHRICPHAVVKLTGLRTGSRGLRLKK